MPTVCPEKLHGSQKSAEFSFTHKKTGPKPCFSLSDNEVVLIRLVGQTNCGLVVSTDTVRGAVIIGIKQVEAVIEEHVHVLVEVISRASLNIFSQISIAVCTIQMFTFALHIGDCGRRPKSNWYCATTSKFWVLLAISVVLVTELSTIVILRVSE